MNKRLGDQVLILEAVSKVRQEFKDAVGRGESFIVTGEIMVRLCTLYSLLNVDQLKDVAVMADDRNERKAA